MLGILRSPRSCKGISLIALVLFALSSVALAQRTVKPVLHGKKWVAITGKPLAATAGAMIFARGGNAVDAACAMLAGGLMVMLAEFGTMSLEEVLGPAMEMAAGYPIEKAQADNIERRRRILAQWPDSKRVLLPHLDEEDPEKRAAPHPGEIFRQLDLLSTLDKLVDAERSALAAGRSREQAIQAAYDRFYRGDVAEEIVRGVREQGGLMTLQDLDRWRVELEEPATIDYKGIEVYKLTHWVQGPVMLQALNILENVDLKDLGYNSSVYIHALYQSMNLAFADRDFYYGDPYKPPAEPIEGLLSKEYARQRFETIDWKKNDANIKPGDPYPFQGGSNPYLELLERWTPVPPEAGAEGEEGWQQTLLLTGEEAFRVGTTSIQAADADGWVVSVTPSGGWIPAFIAGHTGIGLSQRMQSFVLDERLNPYNLVAPGKRPRATLTPGMALEDGKPYLSFAVQGGDTQDQNLLQFFLNVVEFGMNVQQAVEAANITSYQMQSSFGAHKAEPGRLVVREDVPRWVQSELRKMGYEVETRRRTSGPITAIYFDRENGSFWGGASDYGEDYGIAW
jgi:gamma-glutamyltranspeptidase/glutathione hydrolase